MVVVEMVERSTGRRPQGVPGGGRGRQPLGWAKFPHGYPHMVTMIYLLFLGIHDSKY